MREIKQIVVHCSAGNRNQKAADIVHYHMGAKSAGCLGWSAPGYHYIVEADGTVVNTWDEDKISNGVKGHNSHIINVCWVGGIDTSKANHPAIDNRTEAQKRSLIKLIKELKAKYAGAEVLGHRDFSEDKNGNGIIDPWERIKECPCFDAIPEYKDV